jgi:hypothetical protein
MELSLDHTIAAALGWQKQPSGWWATHNRTMSPYIPPWSCDPSEAWDLVQWARQHAVHIALEVDALHVTCEFSLEGPSGREALALESAPRMPEAVARAFLRALVRHPQLARHPSAQAQQT